MFFRQVLHEDLGCASYVVADGGEAAVVDPKWEIEEYLALAREHQLRIRHVLETHNHADHLSGHGRLAAATGATLHISREADAEYEHEEGARDLHRSLGKLLEQEDFLEVWPAHVGGSLCGGAGMSEKPGSTLGFERRFNPLLRIEEEDEFVRELTGNLAPQPPNFERIVELNRGPLVTETSTLEPLTPTRAHELLEQGATLVDGRDPREFN